MRSTYASSPGDRRHAGRLLQAEFMGVHRKMPRVTWAVIGATGMIGTKAVPDGIMAAENCGLVAVQGLNKADVLPLAEKWGVPGYTSAEEMLKSTTCDAVYVASPQDVHLEHVKMCVAHGRQVLCEKPLACNGEEAREMVEICARAGLRLGTAFNLRFNTLHVKARELISSGVIGKVVSARCQYGQNYPPDRRSFRQIEALAGGGSMIDMGNHAMDLVEFVTGKKFKHVLAVRQNVVHDYEVEDACAALLEFVDGGCALVDTYYCVPLNLLRNDLEVNGSGGVLYTVDTLRGMATGGKLVVVTEAARDEYQFSGVDMYRAEFEAFAAAVLNGMEPPCNGRDGLHSQRLIDACYASARLERKIEIIDDY